MTTKRAAKQKDIIPDGWYTIRETVKHLQAQHIDISYPGLTYYRKLGIIGEPRRFKGYMDKFYYYPDVSKYIETAKVLTKLVNIKLEQLKRIVKKLPKEIYFNLPSALFVAWAKPIMKGKPPSASVTTTYGTLYLGMAKVLENVSEKYDPSISAKGFMDLVDKETKKIMKTNIVYSDPSEFLAKLYK